jgi:Transposase
MWLKRPANLTERQRDLFDELLAQPLKTVRAYTLAQQFGSFYELPDPDTAEEYLRRWITEVNSSGLEPLIKFTRMLEDHWLGVIRWHHSKVSNGLLEGLNSLIQAAKRRARGYRSNRNFITMIYLIVGNSTPAPSPHNPPKTWRSLKRSSAGLQCSFERIFLGRGHGSGLRDGVGWQSDQCSNPVPQRICRIRCPGRSGSAAPPSRPRRTHR